MYGNRAWPATILVWSMIGAGLAQKTTSTPTAPQSSSTQISTPAQSQPPAQSSTEAAKTSLSGQKDPTETKSPAVQIAIHWVVLIDPGHGGADAGAKLSDKLAEKDFNLQFARKLKAELQSKGVPAQLDRKSVV